MGEVADLLANQERDQPTAKVIAHPAGWVPSVRTEGNTAVAVSAPTLNPATPDEAELIRGWHLDPDEWMIDGDLLANRWEQKPGGDHWLHQYKAHLVRRTAGVTLDVDELVKMAGRKAPAKPTAADTADHPALVVSINDWQIGKGEGGGSTATVDRIVASIAGVRARCRELARLGRRPSSVVLANTGDLVEQVTGHYASQAFTVDLNLREQCRVARRLLFRFVDELVTDGYPVLVTASACNHGENRGAGGKHQTTPDDNLSLTIVEGIEEACAVNPERYSGVTFAYAKDLTMVVDIAGVNVGLTHGHQIRGGGGGAADKVARWWTGQVMGCQPIATADILLTAHLHHLNVSEESGRTVIIAPAIDGGSYWFTSATGKSSPPGMLTFTVGAVHPRGWSDLAVV